MTKIIVVVYILILRKAEDRMLKCNGYFYMDPNNKMDVDLVATWKPWKQSLVRPVVFAKNSITAKEYRTEGMNRDERNHQKHLIQVIGNGMLKLAIRIKDREDDLKKLKDNKKKIAIRILKEKADYINKLKAKLAVMEEETGMKVESEDNKPKVEEQKSKIHRTEEARLRRKNARKLRRRIEMSLI